jgi:hypothetical protein
MDSHTSDTSSGEGAGFWPGYVDVLVNVVLSIVFVVGLLATALSTIDIRPVQKLDSNDVRGASETESKAIDGLGKAPVAAANPASSSAPEPRLLLVVRAQQTQSDAAGQVTVTDQPSSSGRVLRVQFLAESVDMQVSADQALREAVLSTEVSDESAQWIIWMVADTQHSPAARLALLRLLSVRNALLQAGIAPRAIQTRLLNVAPGQDNGANWVMVARAPAQPREPAQDF